MTVELELRRRFPDRPNILERTNCVNRVKVFLTTAATVASLTAVVPAAKTLESELKAVEQLWAGQKQLTAAAPHCGRVAEE